MQLEAGDELILQLGPEGLLVSTAAQVIERAQRYVSRLRQEGEAPLVDPLANLLTERRREAKFGS